jgi:hypothetical protein
MLINEEKGTKLDPDTEKTFDRFRWYKADDDGVVWFFGDFRDKVYAGGGNDTFYSSCQCG